MRVTARNVQAIMIKGYLSSGVRYISRKGEPIHQVPLDTTASRWYRWITYDNRTDRVLGYEVSDAQG